MTCAQCGELWNVVEYDLMGQHQVIPCSSFFEGLQFQLFDPFYITKVLKTVDPTRCCPLNSFKLEYIPFEVGTVCLEGVFKMRSHQPYI